MALSYVYDALNRLITKTTPEQVYTFGYDSLSRLTSASNAVSSLSFIHDAVGQLLEATTVKPQLNVALSYNYDSAGRKTSLTDPVGTTSYGYDGVNRLTSLTYPQSNNFAIGYDKGGRRTSLSGPLGISKTYEYDNANRLLSLINKINDIEISPFQYLYDKAGNRTQKTDKYGLDQYLYDANYRLLSSSLNAEAFVYDLTGNITKKDGVIRTFSAFNQFLSNTSSITATYDNNGNMTSKITSEGVTWSYIFSSENKLLQATSSDGKNVTYQYDALGRKITRVSGGKTTQYIYDGEDVLLEYENNILTSRYTHGPKIDEPLSKTDIQSGDNYFYHADALGSITAITNSTGTIIESYRYTSYGTPAVYNRSGEEVFESTISNTYLFTGQNYDYETKLHDYWNRYYDSELNIFISPDPIGFFDGPNRYSMVRSNPINETDPFGLFAVPTPLPPSPVPAPGPVGGSMGESGASSVDSGPDQGSGEEEGECEEKENKKCRFVREVYYEGPTKTCWYEGRGGMFTFPQDKDKPCPPIDPDTCMVVTTGLPGGD
ncbi:MAG: RHS repeat-associated core domain-containing protein [Chlamydiae bacterium]|nr:RHS repeat-associated core domain-containing protein [Chlamydiota bacterium]